MAMRIAAAIAAVAMTPIHSHLEEPARARDAVDLGLGHEALEERKQMIRGEGGAVTRDRARGRRDYTVTIGASAAPGGASGRPLADPSYDSVEGWRVELTPGDLLIIPSEWLHYVETIETSLTNSAAWIDGSNWHAYVRDATKH